MKNGTPSNSLILVDSNGYPIAGQDALDDAVVDYNTDLSLETTAQDASAPSTVRNTLFVFMAVSIACLTAAVATGSYAIWLARRQAAQRVLTDVNDLLETCQTRIQQLEADFQNRPSRAS